MKYLKRTVLVIMLILIAIAIYNYPKLNIISGYAAKNMASSLYVAGREVADITANDNNIPLIKLADTETDNTQKVAKASVFGLMSRKALFREGLGCVLISEDEDSKLEYQTPNRQIPENNLAFPYGSETPSDSLFLNVDYDRLQKAVEAAFDRPEIQKTRSVLVVYKDRILTEQYSGGIFKETPVLGWSMTKSVLATLFGILEYQKKLDVSTYAPFDKHKIGNGKDSLSKKAISLNHLLRMQSGLSWDEDYSQISDVTRMLFLLPDMTKIQADKAIIAAPGEIWNYSSGTSNFLSGVLRRELVVYQEYLDFPYRELIDKIGMYSMLIETDMSGNYVGSAYAWATTRDWAKFGLLYLHRGDWNGTRIFDEQWVDYVSEPTYKSDGTYGAHFWLNANGKYPGVPKDLFSANGYQGQYVFIIPSKDLVIVRTGLAEAPDFELNNFLKGIVEAIE